MTTIDLTPVDGLPGGRTVSATEQEVLDEVNAVYHESYERAAETETLPCYLCDGQGVFTQVSIYPRWNGKTRIEQHDDPVTEGPLFKSGEGPELALHSLCRRRLALSVMTRLRDRAIYG